MIRQSLLLVFLFLVALGSPAPAMGPAIYVRTILVGPQPPEACPAPYIATFTPVGGTPAVLKSGLGVGDCLRVNDYSRVRLCCESEPTKCSGFVSPVTKPGVCLRVAAQ